MSVRIRVRAIVPMRVSTRMLVPVLVVVLVRHGKYNRFSRLRDACRQVRGRGL